VLAGQWRWAGGLGFGGIVDRVCGCPFRGGVVCLRSGRVPVFRYRRVTPHRSARRRPLVSAHGEKNAAPYATGCSMA